MNEVLPKSHAETGFFQAGGTLKADVPSYIERPADHELYQSIVAGEYCYILTPRQMGKSSLMTRTAARLRAVGVHVAVIDLTGIGGDAGSITADEWYYSLAHRLLRELQVPFLLAPWWKEQLQLSPLNRLMNFFEEGVLAQVEGRIAVFVDEIDTTIKLPFSDDFFAAIRACFNARGNNEAYSRLSFVLLGVASPADLIRDPVRTPFNIGKRIDLADFSPSEAQQLLPGFGTSDETAHRLITRIVYWTNGHPFLTQRLCILGRAEPTKDEDPDATVDRIVAAEYLGQGRRTKEDHLKVVHERIAQAGNQRAAQLNLYVQVLKGKPVQEQPQSPIHAALKLSGLVKADEQGRLVVRNRIYEHVFDAAWIKRLRPPRLAQRSVAVVLLLSTLLVGWWIGAQQLTVRSGTAIVLAWLGIAYPEPEMVDIPAGTFNMGSPNNEEGRGKDEGPQHQVSMAAFRLGKLEVSFDEYDVFAFLVKRDGGCADGHDIIRPADEGWGRGQRPVINVSWRDAICYAEWLSQKTGKHYRLPTEAEWEYAARAGTTTPYYWGDNADEACLYENVFDSKNAAAVKKREKNIFGEPYKCADPYPFTAPVGQFKPNAYALHDMLGNVMEWVRDCYHEDYQEAPKDGTAWEDGVKTCVQRAGRGSSWGSLSGWLRSTARFGYSPDARYNSMGFRLAQDK